jgi:hypothetical protein
MFRCEDHFDPERPVTSPPSLVCSYVKRHFSWLKQLILFLKGRIAMTEEFSAFVNIHLVINGPNECAKDHQAQTY